MNNCCFNPLVQYNKITFGLLMTVEKGHAGSGEGYAGQQLLFQGDRYTYLIKTTRITFTLKARLRIFGPQPSSGMIFLTGSCLLESSRLLGYRGYSTVLIRNWTFLQLGADNIPFCVLDDALVKRLVAHFRDRTYLLLLREPDILLKVGLGQLGIGTQYL